jgi:predicted metal-binding membrane protein
MMAWPLDGDEAAASGPSGFDLLRQRLGWHPEWPSLVLCAAVWSGLILEAVLSPSAAIFCGREPGLATAPIEWAAMLAAMMLPLIVPIIRRVAFASLWRRRHRAVAAFLLGYGLLWSIPGLLGFFVMLMLEGHPERGQRGWAVLLAFAAAALWEMMPAKRRALTGCHRTIPLRPGGWKADVDCLRLGAIQGRSCIAACWLMMIGPALAPAHVPVMAAVTAIAAVQRYRPRRHRRIEALSLASLGLACASFG